MQVRWRDAGRRVGAQAIATETIRENQRIYPALRSEFLNANLHLRKNKSRGAWMAQLVKHGTHDLGVVSSRPTLGVSIT